MKLISSHMVKIKRATMVNRGHIKYKYFETLWVDESDMESGDILIL